MTIVRRQPFGDDCAGIVFATMPFENRMREAYGLEGVPLVIDFVPHSGGRGRAN